jgi:hypothetical protein
VYLAIFSLLSLWPFDFIFFKSNSARLIETTGGIELPDNGQVLSISSTEEFYHRIVTGSGFSLETWVSPKNTVQSGPARIITYSLNPYLRNFTLAQSEEKLVMRLRTTETDLNGIIPHLEVDDVFVSDKIRHIVVTYNFFEQNIYVDGKLRVRKQIPRGRFSNWDSSYYLVIGNEATGDRPWLGKIYYVAIYNRPLRNWEVSNNYLAGWLTKDKNKVVPNRASKGTVARYEFKEKSGKILRDTGTISQPLDMHIPGVIGNYDISYLYPSVFLSPGDSQFEFSQLLHIIAYFPVGLILYEMLNRRFGPSYKVIIFVLIVGTLIAVFVELLQHFLPSRHPSVIDVLCHLMGLSFGIGIGALMLPKENYMRTGNRTKRA